MHPESSTVRAVVLGDRYARRRELLNFGDGAMVEGYHHLLREELGWTCAGTPWKPFPFLTFRRLRRASGAAGPEAVFERWFRQALRARPRRVRCEQRLLRAAAGATACCRPLAAGLEARCRARLGLGLWEALRPRLFRAATAAAVLDTLRGADLALFLGGGLMADHLARYAPSFLFEVYLARRLGLRVAAVSESVSVTTPLLRRAVGAVYGGVELHLAREPLSRDALLALGVPAERIAVAPDFAFAAPTPPAARTGASRLVLLVIRGDRPLCLPAWRAVARRLRERGREARWAATCPVQDRGAGAALERHCGVAPLTGVGDYGAFLRALNDCEALITDRFHAAIFALKMGTALLPVRANTFKLDGLLRGTGYPLPVQPVLDEATCPALLAALDRLLQDSSAHAAAAAAAGRVLTERLRQTVPPLLRELAAAGRPAAHHAVAQAPAGGE